MQDKPGWASAYSLPNPLNKVRLYPGSGVKPPKGVAAIICAPKPNPFAPSKHAIVKTLARYLPAGEGGSTGTKTFAINVYTPSNRLRLHIRVVFEADAPNQKDVVLQAGNEPTWSITTMSRNPESGREVAMQNAYPTSGTANLPDGYEVDTAAEILRVNVTLKDTNFSTSYVAATERVNCQLICTWEPNIEMPDAEKMALLAQCSVGFGQPTLITNSAA